MKKKKKTGKRRKRYWSKIKDIKGDQEREKIGQATEIKRGQQSGKREKRGKYIDRKKVLKQIKENMKRREKANDDEIDGKEREKEKK